MDQWWGSQPLKSSLQVGSGIWPWGLSYKAFNLPSHPDHKYIYGLGVGISTIKKFTSGRGGVWPWGLNYNAFNLPSHPDHKYIWFKMGIQVTFFKADSPLASPPIPNIKFLSFVVSEKCVILKICTFSKRKKNNTEINLNFELALNNMCNNASYKKLC